MTILEHAFLTAIAIAVEMVASRQESSHDGINANSQKRS